MTPERLKKLEDVLNEHGFLGYLAVKELIAAYRKLEAELQAERGKSRHERLAGESEPGEEEIF